MKNQADYSKWKCPYEHIEKECGHELYGPEGYEGASVWCACGFRGPVFCLDPDELNLEIKKEPTKWYENIPDGGVLCSVGTEGQIDIIKKSDMNKNDERIFISDITYWYLCKPITKEEIQAFMDNAPEEV